MQNDIFITLPAYIVMGVERQGGVRPLALYLDQSNGAVRDVRRGTRGLPIYACLKLAELIGVTPLEVIAASELVTEKRKERRAVFLPYLKKLVNDKLD